MYFAIARLIFTGYRRQLLFDDIWELKQSDQCETLLPKFEAQWAKELAKHNQLLVYLLSCYHVTIGSIDYHCVGAVNSARTAELPFCY